MTSDLMIVIFIIRSRILLIFGVGDDWTLDFLFNY